MEQQQVERASEERERELAKRISCDDSSDDELRQFESGGGCGKRVFERNKMKNLECGLSVSSKSSNRAKLKLNRERRHSRWVSRGGSNRKLSLVSHLLLACALCSFFTHLVNLIQQTINHNNQANEQQVPRHYYQVQAFNIDTQSAIVHAGPENSYFGYTVAQHRDRGVNWLLVGAPKAQTNQARTPTPGAVYRCTATSARACQQILFDPNGSSTITLKGEQVQQDDKSHQWFGASLQSATENGSIVACAPSYVYYSANLKRRDPVGSCWISRGSFEGFLEYSPCRLNDQWGHHHLGSCQAGFASAITRDGSKLFMAAPGSHVWQGQVFAHNLKSDLTSSTSSVNPHSEDDSYLGYSLALGRFSSATSNSLTNSADSTDLAIGIPRGSELAGKVMIVDREMKTLRNITGEQVGAYFGYSLATIDLNGDGLDDLVIGAPLYYNQTNSHKEPHFDRGRVYVAYQSVRHEFAINSRLDGHKNRARFGTSLANCGDLNRDGIPDLAVGAPYDGPEGHGAVYIYMGNKKQFLSNDYDQVIYAEAIRSPEGNFLRSFGFSLSGSLDIDGNQYPDLLVGDYKADRAILLKSRPVVSVTTSMTFTPEHFNLDDRSCVLASNSSQTVPCINVQYCTKYTGLGVDARLGFVYDIKLDSENNKGAPRLFLLSNEGKSEDRNSSLLTKDVQQCRNFKVYIRREIRDKLTPLKVDIEYNLASDNSEQYDYSAKLRPVLNRASGQPTNRMSRVALVQNNCGRDNVCVPDLKLSLTPNLDSYTIGSNEKLVLDVQVKNLGEDAFESMFFLVMPMTIDFNSYNKSRPDATYPICYRPKPDQTGENVLACDLGNPQARNEAVKFSVLMEPARHAQFNSPDFTFVAHVNSSNPEVDDKHREDNQLAIGIPIRVETQLVLSGSSSPPLVGHNSTQHAELHNVVPGSNAIKPGRLSEADVGPEVTHTYQLQNRGPSRISDIAVSILWPTHTKDGQDFLLYLVDDPLPSGAKVRCKPSPDNSINPLGLKYLAGNSVVSPTMANYQRTITAQQNNQTARYRRQTSPTEPEAMAQQIGSSVDESVMQQLNMLTCGPQQCTRFECNVYDLGHNEIATIKIRSRLFEETISKLSLQKFDISSKLVAQIKALPYNVSTASMPPYVHKVETQVHTTGLAVQDLLSGWIIVLAILLGILLFALLACFLNYLGFFARKRPPKTAEREPLTPTMWNDYQYTPGDTAL